VDVILDLLNIDPVTTLEKLKRDVMTQNDPIFNELTRSMYASIGQKLAEESDAIQKIAKNLGIKWTKPDQGGGRFSGPQQPEDDGG
jgi:hypothetical protein